jgi:hypothetical protein
MTAVLVHSAKEMEQIELQKYSGDAPTHQSNKEKMHFSRECVILILSISHDCLMDGEQCGQMISV